MSFEWNAWITLAVRWVHIFASILWVGTTYYFTWLDGRFSELEKAGAGEAGAKPQVWMVHSGGFYRVDKTKTFDVAFPLHWFRWEAAITWLSGIVLLGLVYYAGGVMVDETVAELSNGRAVALGIAVLIFGWTIYDLTMSS